MAPHETPKPRINLMIVEAKDGRPTGKVEYVTYGDNGEVESREEGFVPPEEILKTGGRSF